jgi:putative MATE family efflux protein
MFFIGQINDTNMVAAVALAFPLFMLSQALGNIFAMGGSTYISRMLGAQKYDEARKVSAVSFLTAIAIGILLTVVFYIFKAPVLRLIGASDATFVHADGYFSVIALFMAFAVAGTAMSGQMLSEGETKKAMMLQVIGIILNIILDPIFILVFKMGTAGAAWATVAGQVASFGYGVFYFLSKKTILSIKPVDYRPNRTMMKQILSIGIPAGISNVMISMSNILINRTAADYGDYVVAGNGVQMRVTNLFFMLIAALTMGYQPFVGYNFGAKQYDRLRNGFKLTLLYSTGICVAGSVVLGLFGNGVIRLFIDDPQTIEAGAKILRRFVWGFPFMGAQLTLMSTFQAFGKPLQAMVISMGRHLLFFVPLLFILNHFFGFDGFIWARPGTDILTTSIAIILGLSLIKLMRGDVATTAAFIGQGRTEILAELD